MVSARRHWPSDGGQLTISLAELLIGTGYRLGASESLDFQGFHKFSTSLELEGPHWLSEVFTSSPLVLTKLSNGSQIAESSRRKKRLRKKVCWKSIIAIRRPSRLPDESSHRPHESSPRSMIAGRIWPFDSGALLMAIALYTVANECWWKLPNR